MKTLVVLIALSAAVGSISLEPGSTLSIAGTSTVRSYRCTANSINSAISIGSKQDLASVVDSARVSIPLAQLECGNGTMNEHMRNALKAREHPNVVFALSAYRVDGLDAVLSGTLTIAGTTRPIMIPASIQNEAGTLRVKATRQINMSDWGVKPPSLMLGTLKVRDPVTITFDVTLKP